MRSRWKSVLVAFVLSVSATLVVLLPGSPAQAYSCPQRPTNLSGIRHSQLVNTTNVNLRTGPSTTCVSLGYVQPWHSGWTYCYTYGRTVNGSSLWIYAFSNQLGRYGWIHGALMYDYQRLACRF